ncbi:CapA family protein [Flavihumibacter rivuli]|uniref:CapA family protein n=1 Tax=Flavihumibacter rivuli TaxID=2838156 RepID=UPI001BDDD115|nr:CapA family protein [Flavihumibacter rivuli]ULQ57782.1 CapA family protein [Flavihumibacter rivuli]
MAVETTICIGFTGDVMIGRGVDEALNENGVLYAWGNTLPFLKKTDINIINLENTLTNSNHQALKTFNFKATPDKVNTLTAANITIANLANNHILDYHEEGLLETIATLDKAGIKHAGAGRNAEEAARPVVIQSKGLTIGLLGFTDNEPSWKAGPDRCGVNYIDIDDEGDRKNATIAISQLNQEVDIVIVSIHWGPNMNTEPSATFVDFAHQMADAGAAIIHGHSAHNFQGVEVYQEKLILYDTGDFVDDYRVDPFFRNDHSFFYRVMVDKYGPTSLELIPVLITQYQVNLAQKEARQWSIQNMKALAEKWGTAISDNGVLTIRNDR